jgi:hypothetical protein
MLPTQIRQMLAYGLVSATKAIKQKLNESKSKK